ncbi:hypothetical protein F909_04028 [Acinetobacter sp. ANC 3929]|uniref:helix-turn-helix domain-containing protein n=1 Tax=unclassified Acinetobacter TaxID=196816 RepID=UPI0002D1068E|nr:MULTISPECIES: AraC family transcriptional regulator [unclassified Acinetobacter]ENW78339.1 hypothetical protein F909_04028 [Acinetobacter sp. ANC 3929]MCH7353877.1 AraC family transcriptional regulator [Acinetobacter sp. NIPH 2023]MCH7355480.1 AraC family transcriptional regulator [Acinetobacter sp. NIPH 1958]MCH7361194.1 AraC family transcriptional regulator [Acinetobacter sp. NIPH 2024]
MNKNPTINGSIAGMFLEFISENHLDIPLGKTYLESWKIDGRVPLLELGLCLRLIQEKCPESGLGMKIAQYFQPVYSGLLGYLILPCQNFNEAIMQFKKYYALMWDGFSVDIIEDDESVTVSWNVPSLEIYKNHTGLLEIIRIGYELGISCFIKMLHQLTNAYSVLQPTLIKLPGNQPENTNIYHEFFQCPVLFDASRGAVSFNAAILKFPINLNNTYFLELLDRQAEAYLKSINLEQKNIHTDFVLKFQKVLGHGIEEGNPTLDYVAKELAMSKSTLHKRLLDQDLNFQTLLDKVRLELAKMYMTDQLLSLAEISNLLAFSEQSAFNRFFKRVTGLSPSKYRKSFL